MLIAGSQQLGFDPFSAVASAAKSVASVARRDDVQRAAVAAAHAYAPNQFNKVTEYADRARGMIPVAPAAAVQPVPLPMPTATAMPDSYGELAPQTAPVQKGNLTTIAIVGGVAVVLLLLMTRK